MVQKGERVREIEAELEELFKQIVKGEDTEETLRQYDDKVKPLFGQNIQFVRAYIGFLQQGEAYSREDFARLLNVSIPMLKSWELGYSLPNYYSLRRILQFINQHFPIEIGQAHLYCKSLTRLLTYLPVSPDHPMSKDVEPRKNALDAMVASTLDYLEIFQILQSSEEVALYILQPDENGVVRISFVNEGFGKKLGYSSSKELIGRPVMDLVYPDDHQAVQERIQKRLTGEIERADYVFRVVGKNGSIHIWQVNGVITRLSNEPAIVGTVHEFGNTYVISSIIKTVLGKNPSSLVPFLEQYPGAILLLNAQIFNKECTDLKILCFNKAAEEIARTLQIPIKCGDSLKDISAEATGDEFSLHQWFCELYQAGSYRVYENFQLKRPDSGKPLILRRLHVICIPYTNYMAIIAKF